MRAPLVPAAATVWATALVAVMFPGAAVWIALGLWGAVVAVCAGLVALPAVRRRRGIALLAVALAVSAAAASHVALAGPARDAAASFGVENGRAVEVTAVVASKVSPAASGALWFDADAGLLTAGDVSRRVAVPIAVSVAPENVALGPRGLDLGARVVARGTAKVAGAGDRAVLVVFASRGVEVVDLSGDGAAVASGLRHGLVRLASTLPGDGGRLLPGLSVGDTSAVGAELDSAMKLSSLSHLTAVSGANCAIIVGLVFGACALAGARRWVRVACALAALGGFVVLVTPEPSVVRAAAMATVAMLAVLLGRTAIGLSVLCVAIVVLLVGDPWLATSLGFALSAAATAALLVLAPPLARGLGRFMPRALALVLAVPLAAQLACGPLLILVNPVVPLHGVVANLVAGPAAPVATVLGLAACLLAPVLPWLASAIAGVAWAPAAWVAATATTVSALPAASVPWWEGWGGLAALALLGACIVVLIVRVRGSPRRVLVLRGVAVVVVAGAVGALSGLAALSGPLGRLTTPSGWAVAACDVGQGDAVLVRSAGSVALIDTGPDPAPLRACLARLGVDRIDLAVLTHYDLDHVGGAEAIIGRAGIVLHGPVDGADDAALLRRLDAGGARVVAAHAGMSGSLGDARWRVLWPRDGSRAFEAGNDSSVVVDVRGGGVPASLFLGDLSASPQAALTASGMLRPPYAIVKVAHHGSADQHPDLYRAARAAVALVCVGADNTYGHPRAEVLALLASTGTRVARSDRDGLVLLTPTAGGLDVWRERVPPGSG
ncbi:MAG: ComEC/Rec2 family competence protein [Microbacterium sp.]|uniref:ComEC/Rec2 family competence protein n=1 Tax=Microbacterium sp. TaxID=51671 RepID=UPI0039E5CA41